MLLLRPLKKRPLLFSMKPGNLWRPFSLFGIPWWLPGMRETWVWSLVQEVPLGKEMATHSSILVWMEEPGRLYIVHGAAKSQTQLSNFTFFFFFFSALLCVIICLDTGQFPSALLRTWKLISGKFIKLNNSFRQDGMERRVAFVWVLGRLNWSSNSFILSYFSPLCLFALHSGIAPPFHLPTCLLRVLFLFSHV